jgi:hypothetical protein
MNTTELKDRLIEQAVLTFFHNTAEGESIDTIDGNFTISDDHTTVAKYSLLENATGRTKGYNSIHKLFAGFPKNTLAEFVNYYK